MAPARIAWRLAAVTDVLVETPNAKTLVLDVPGWPGHVAGQHVDVRLTAEDGYQAQRSYSIASAPDDTTLALTVERLEDGEVSPYLTDELGPGDELELRGAIGVLARLDGALSARSPVAKSSRSARSAKPSTPLGWTSRGRCVAGRAHRRAGARDAAIPEQQMCAGRARRGRECG